ncbi:Kunitz/Bovine pancreatic trypsin inhibitor domain protein [Aphelenchoides bicaudatus]|nr:Kunitz/Bovine pancreatic trypsin inhibitor domain protein [Aphelenchoides bicaudatus]
MVGGGELGSGHGVTQPPNLIRFIANTIRDVGSAQKTGKNGNTGKSHNNEDNLESSDLSSAQICNMPRNLGHNRCGKPLWSHRFHFDQKTSRCLPFWFLGCSGNKNNFKTEQECQQLCFGQARHQIHQIF